VRSALFWEVMQHGSDNSALTLRDNLLVPPQRVEVILEYGTNRLSRNVGTELPLLYRITSQKSADLTYTAA